MVEIIGNDFKMTINQIGILFFFFEEMTVICRSVSLSSLLICVFVF